MRRFAFFLSSEKYKNYSDTPYCHADAELLRNTLIEKCDYLPENSPILKLEENDGVMAEQILEKIFDLVQRSEDGDSILFFYAGHGIAIGSSSYLVLPGTSHFNEESTSLKLSDINHCLSKNKRFNIRIFDCCHSGEGSRNVNAEIKIEEFMRAILSEGSDCSLTLASCAAHEKSYTDDASGNGIFTSSLVNAINEKSVGADIYLENLKIDVCSAVQAWSLERGKNQTPTLSGQLSGNMPIARRKAQPEAEIKVPEIKKLSIADRLCNARKLEVVDERLYPEMAAALNIISEKFESLIGDIELYGIDLKKMTTQKVEEIPEFLKQKIISRMKSHKTMHAMGVERLERQQLKGLFNSIFENKPIFDNHYYINQKYDMPDCFLTFESNTDGYLPSLSLFFYICPLQASIALLSGYYFNRSYNEAESKIEVQKIIQEIHSIDNFRGKKYLLGLDDLLLALKIDVEMEIEERLSHLERESKIV